MNNQLQHLLDRYLGAVLCWLFSQLEKIFRLFRSSKEVPVRKILFVKPVEQGAIILAWPALNWAVQKVGRENVYFFSFEKNRAILDLLEIIPEENVVTASDRGVFSFAFSMLRALYRLRRLKIDTAVDLEVFARISVLIAWLSGARNCVGLSRFSGEGPYRGNLVTHPVQYNPYMHISQAFEVHTRAAFADKGDAPLLKESVPPLCTELPQFVPTEEDMAALTTVLQNHLSGWSPEKKSEFPLILFNPKCIDELPVRKWPDSYFVALGQMLRKSHPDAYILITGLDNEKEACHAMASAIGEGAFSLAGEVTLRGLITLMTVGTLLVSSDSGPAHFAVLTGLKSVVLFGPETPDLYGPLDRDSKLVYLRLACSPCFSPMNYRLSPCKNNQCMLQISAEQVHEAVCEGLGG